MSDDNKLVERIRSDDNDYWVTDKKAQEIIEQLLERVSALESFKNGSFDATWPVGVVYVQYPDQKPPTELFADTGSQWQLLSYDGAFFRAEGGRASEFNSGEQGDSIKAHNHNISHTHNRGTMEITGRCVVGSGCNSSHNTNTWDFQNADGAFISDWDNARSWLNGGNNHTLCVYSGSFIASRSWTGETSEPTNGGWSGNAGDDECRPVNRTIRVWKRTS